MCVLLEIKSMVHDASIILSPLSGKHFQTLYIFFFSKIIFYFPLKS